MLFLMLLLLLLLLHVRTLAAASMQEQYRKWREWIDISTLLHCVSFLSLVIVVVWSLMISSGANGGFSLLQHIQSSQLYPVFSDHVSSWLVLAVEMPCILWVVWLTWLCLCLCGHREAKLDCSTNFLTILRSCSIFHHYQRAVREYMYYHIVIRSTVR